MILWLVIFIVFVYLMLRDSSNNFRWDLDCGDYFAAGIMSFGIASIISITILTIATGTLETESKLIEEYKIYALSNSSGVEGSFFLGSGSVSNKMRYFIIKEYKTGQKLDSFDIERSWIEINNEVEPKVEKYNSIFSNSFIQKIFTVTINKSEYKITIPEGSIKYNFNVELP